MKKNLLIAFLGFLFPVILTAQTHKPAKTDRTEENLARLRERLMLNDKEYKVFKDEYYRYQNERRKLIQHRRELFKSLNGEGKEKMSDEAIRAKLHRLQEVERQLFEAKQRHFDRVMKILPPRKALTYWRYNYRHFKRHQKHPQGDKKNRYEKKKTHEYQRTYEKEKGKVKPRR